MEREKNRAHVQKCILSEFFAEAQSYSLPISVMDHFSILDINFFFKSWLKLYFAYSNKKSMTFVHNFEQYISNNLSQNIYPLPNFLLKKGDEVP